MRSLGDIVARLAPGEKWTGSAGNTWGMGWEWMEHVSEREPAWHPISSWGRDGFDLGNWPYVILAASADPPAFAEYVEGDLVVKRCASIAERDAELDGYAEAWWRRNPSRAPGGLAECPEGELPGHLRGPFSWERLREQA